MQQPPQQWILNKNAHFKSIVCPDETSFEVFLQIKEEILFYNSNGLAYVKYLDNQLVWSIHFFVSEKDEMHNVDKFPFYADQFFDSKNYCC